MSHQTTEKHEHRPLPNTNRCKDCGELIHNLEKPDSKADALNKSLGNAKSRVDHASKMIGITIILVVVGLFIFPLGIILWIIGVIIP